MKKVREGYKMTEVGVIPNEWNVDKLVNLVEKITDGTHRTPQYTDYGVPFLRVTDIQKSKVDWNNVKYISEEEHNELIERCNPELGDILYSKNGTIGIPKIIDWDRKFSIFVSLCLIKMKKEGSKLSNKYLEEYLGSDNCLSQIRLRTKKGTVTNLHLEEIRELFIPIPPLKEQQKISSILSSIDDQIEITDNLIKKTKELKKGLMQRLLTKGIGHDKFKDTEIGRIPEEWEVRKLSNITDVRDGTHDSPKYLNEGVPFVTSKNLKEHGIDFEEINFISQEDHERFSQRSKVDDGDILFGMIGTIGNPVIVKKEFDFSIKNVALIKFNNQCINNLFLLYVLKSNIIINQFNKLSNGGVQKFIALAMIRNLYIPVPTICEQQKIASILMCVDKKIEEYESKKTKLQELKKGLMQKLLTGKIRVRV